MTTKLLNREPRLDNLRQFEVFDDFLYFTDGELWTKVDHDATASIAIVGEGSDAANGLITCTASSDNVEAYLRTTNPVFTIKNDLALCAIARLKIAPATSNAAAMIFGLMANPTANALVDDEGGPAASNCVVFTMNSGATNAENLGVVSNGSAFTAATFNKSSSELTMDTNWYTLMFTIEPLSATEKRVVYWVDPDGGQNMQKLRDSNLNVIQHKLTYTEPAASTNSLSLFAGVKSASADSQVLTIDFMGAWQLRKSYPITGTATD